MPQISVQWVLAIVGAIMLALALKDAVRFRRMTPAIRTRLLVAAIFAAVLVWLHMHQP